MPTGRLAPSPTGRLHLGHARSFLIAWWHARARGGKVLLRIEDLDAGRVAPEMIDAVLYDLRWLGLDWDGPVVRQSQRLELMRAALVELANRGQVYACVCSRADIRRAQSAPHAADGETRYPGTCRGKFPSIADAERATGRPAGLRFVVRPGRVPVEDGFSAPAEYDVAADVGDFLVARRDGAPAYQLAVVVDDAAQGVTEVVRGDDLLSSAARQLLLQEALDLPHPRWIHLPLVVDEQDSRLAKRAGALSLAALRSRGADPRSITAWVAASAGISVPDRVTPEEVTSVFSLDRMPAHPVRVTQDTIENLLR